MGRKAILSHSDRTSRDFSRVGCPQDGLRILAKLIARHILADSWGKTTSGVDKKSTAGHYRGNSSEDLP